MRTRPNTPAGRPRFRRPLALLALAAAGVVVAGVLAPTASPQPTAPGREPLLTAAALAQAELFRLDPEPWKDPPEARREPGKPYPLVIDFARNTVRVGEDGRRQSVQLRSYNGGLVGPTFRVEPGETLLIDLVNRLPKGEGAGDPHAHAAEEHCGVPNPEPINTTNLHTHGLHVSPSGSSDNVLRVIPPGGPTARPERYELPILPAGNPRGEPPMEHYPGTLWYHAHLHGSTAAQLASGMAGALLVEGDLDRIPQVEAARERIFVLQQLAFDKDGEVKTIGDLVNNWIGDKPGDPPRYGPAKHTTVNGVTKPLIVLARRQVERWRMIDAGVFEMLNLSLRKKEDPRQTLPFNLLGLDGITMKRVEAWQEIELGPGYRAEALVQAPDQPGEYLLYKAKPKLSLLALGTEPGAAETDESQIIAVVRVEDRACVMPSCSTHNLAPGTPLPAPLRDIEAREVQPPAKEVTFSFDGNFKINGHCFLPDQVLPAFDLTKGRVEEWVLKNTSDGIHPFHIHVNPFQMVNPDGTPGVWRDTVILQPHEENLRIRTRIERFTGRFVTHCHILIHEDKGMMQLVQVRDPREP